MKNMIESFGVKIMKIKEVLEQYSDTDILHFGSESGYVVICEKGIAESELKAKSDLQIEQLHKMLKLYKARLKCAARYVKKSQAKIERYKAEMRDNPSMADFYIYGGKKMSTPYKKIQDELITAKHNDHLLNIYLPKKVKGYEKAIKDFTPFLEREVVEQYDLLVENGKAIIFEGHENGKYWFASEYNKPVKGFDC